jgi:hypothetical protein
VAAPMLMPATTPSAIPVDNFMDVPSLLTFPDTTLRPTSHLVQRFDWTPRIDPRYAGH